MASSGVCLRSSRLAATSNSGLLSVLFAALLIACLTSLTACSTPSLRSISITPAAGQTILTATGQTAQFRAIGTYQQGTHPATTQDITSSVTWSTGSQDVAQISSPGLVTANGPGTSTVTATTNGASGLIQATSNVQVNLSSTPATGLTSITVIPSTQPITVLGQTAQFVAIGNYTGTTPATQDLTRQVTWASSAPGVATIVSGASGGVATAVSPGTATITATDTGANGATVGTATITVTASAAVGLTAISVIPITQTVLTHNETSQYIAIGTFSGVTPATQDITNSPNLTWVSSDVKVATINSSGLAVENSIGTTAITAEWVQSGSPVITGTATFTSGTSAGTVTLPILSIYKVGNGASTTSSLITTTPAPTPPPLNCGTGTNCTGYFPLGTTVTITVSPVPSDFGGFSSNCTPTSSGSCTITMNNNEAVGVIFY